MGQTPPGQTNSDWPLLATLRRRLRRLVWWSGLSASVIAVLGGLLLAGWCDWWLRIEDFGLRLLISVSLWSIAAATLWRSLWQPLRYPLTDVMLARQLDRRFPGLASRITTAAEFRSHQSDPRFGSPELQGLVIRQARADLEQIAPEDLLEARRLSPLVLTAVMICVVTVAVLQVYPLEAATAVRRLAWPWGRTPWPQAVVLQLLDAEGQPLPWEPRDAVPVVRGDELTLQVENVRGGLPDTLRLQQRSLGPDAAGSIDETPLYPRVHTEEPAPRETAGIALTATEDAIEFRVVGGDDQSMPWFRMVAVDPPRLAEVAIEVTPPAYTRQPPIKLPTGTTQVRGWLGSVVTIAAQADRPVDRVELRTGEQAPQAVALHADQHSWTSTLTITRPNSANFNFVLRDRQGFADPRPMPFELRGDVDALPEIVLTEPAADVWVTPTATIPLAMQARDDLGLTLLRRNWELRREAPSNEESTAHAPQQDLLQEFGESRPLQATHAADWSLTPLQLRAGDRVVFRVEALDAFDLGDPHIGKSAPRTLVVVSPTEKQRELTGRIADVVEELRTAHEQQRRLQTETAQLQTQLRDAGEFRTTDRDLLSRLQADQRRLAGQLTDEIRGLAPRVAQLRAEFPANQLQDAEAEPQLEQLAQQLRGLAETVFPGLDQELTQAQKLIDEATPAGTEREQPQNSSAAAGENLATAEKLQQAVREALLERQQELAQWQTDRQLGNSLKALAEQQQELNQQAAELGAQTIARALPELTPQQRADLAKVADQQRRLAQQVDQIQHEFTELSDRLNADDTQRAAEAQDLADQVDDQQLSQRLRQAADQITANRLGEAGPVQQQAAEMLNRLVEDWSADRPDDTEQMVKQTRDAEQQAEALHDDIDQLQKQSTAAAQAGPNTPIDESLPQDAQELRKRIERLERQLERLKLRRGADAARSMSQRLKSAQQALEAGDHATAAEELAVAAEESLQLQDELTAQREQAEEQLAQEELERIAGALATIKVRQDRVIEETERLEAERQAKGKLSRGQLRSLQDLAGVERELHNLTREAQGKVEQAVVAKAALDSVARNLDQVAQRLDDRTTDTITILLARDASRRLSRILQAWEQSQKQGTPAESEPQAENSEENNESQNAGPPGENLSLKLQLSLLRELQADCLSRTEFLETQRKADGKFTEALQPLLQDLADEQSSLIQLTERLVELYRQSQPAQSPPTETPAAEPPAPPSPPSEVRP